MTNVLRSYERFELLILVFLRKLTVLIPINFYVNVFDDLLEYLIINVAKVLVQLREANLVLIFLEESYHIGLCPLLDEMLILAGLGVINFDV